MATPTDWAVWSGVAVAALALALSAWKWRRSGPRLTVQINPDDNPFLIRKVPYLRIDVSNVGDQATTLTGISEHHLTWHQAIFERIPKSTLLVGLNVGDKFSLPKKMEPGDTYQYMLAMSPAVEERIKGKRFYIGLSHSSSDRPILKRYVQREGEKRWTTIFKLLLTTCKKGWNKFSGHI